ncbi:MAG: amidohydrolase family protein [Clostridia bacterium]|nr:amidohydrolase family protein [Clostridia bacterium]
MIPSYVLKGIFLDTPTPGELRCREGYALCRGGHFAGFYSALPQDLAALPLHDFSGQLILPGMCDLHLHAPQYSYCGTAMDLELLDWLQRYTYPEEGRYRDVAYARRGYTNLTRDLLHSATTRICAFATLHTDATLELMRQLSEAGIRGYVGKLAMDRNSPDFYREVTPEAGLAETRRWLDACTHGEYPGVLPMLTPRFTPSTSDAYMEGLGQLSREYGVAAQSHLSENLSEIEWVKALCPGTAFYAESYARYGLFGGEQPCVMAHCIYCPEEEDELIRRNGVFIAHCPTSNENVIAGIAPAARYLREGYHIGLGSDVAGGHTLNLFAVMASAVQVSKLRWRYVDKSQSPLTIPETLYMATSGGGALFGKVGLFEEGYAFDAIVLDDSALLNHLPFTPGERLERYAYLSDGRPQAKFVDGRRLF